MSLHSLPLFVRLAGRPVILIGEGEAAEAKRRLLARAGAMIVGEAGEAAVLAIVALPEPDAAVARLRARGILVNAVDRPDLCDFTLPAIVDRDPVIVAIGTGGVSAGLAAALRQRLEALLPATMGALAERLFAARGSLRRRIPDMGERRRLLARGMAEGQPLDPLGPGDAAAVDAYLAGASVQSTQAVTIRLRSDDPDDLTLRDARALAQADRVIHDADVPAAILIRARADAERLLAPAEAAEGLTVRIVRA
ncbi:MULTISPECIES: precorrin-2 dehydrogenase/sirohydrochlorin ferrochelatase family protein [Sphingomonas]|uniref:precorrin-2 dehydrogenase/sirohydrochlorin ferrochelatase family protein n=1 Tax=Sphingomonas TaxID=13687 RepID=UPI00193B49D8|nr:MULTISPECIES: bifunctional precorrin-2 dehydrogenase/sirohydrochlorin ferrochelatase [Sphingomonas]